MTIYSGVRVENINTVKDLYIIERHAKRLDSSKDRVDKSKTKSNYLYSDYSDRKGSLNITDNFKELLDSGVKTYGKSRVGLHLIVSISKEWIEETGDIHNPRNPRNIKAMSGAIAWAHEKFGENSILHARMDFDEEGGGNIDLVLTPIHEITQRNTRKRVISPSKSLAKIKKEYPKGKKEFVCLQDSWNEFCKKNIDEKIERGIPKEITKIEHVHHKLLNDITKEIRENMKDDLNNSKLKKIITQIDVCKELITKDKEKEEKKRFNSYKKKFLNHHNKVVNDFKDEIDIKQKTINSQQKQMTNTILENTKLKDDYEKINQKLQEKDKILNQVKEYIRNLSNVPKLVLKLLEIDGNQRAERSAGRQFKGQNGP